jgi:signal transduction histidine kinase/ActR/RegA family two-component response regulator
MTRTTTLPIDKGAHSLLQRQIKKHLRPAGEIPPQWQAFVTAVDNAYKQSDIDREMLERSLEISSQELLHANSGLRGVLEALRERERQLAEAHDKLETRVEERTAALAQAQERLRQAQKMEAIGTLAGGIAHDFNNILGAIIGYNELALMDAADRPVLMRNLKGIAAASRRASQLVQQILAFSRQEESRRKPMSLGPIVNEALDLLRASLPASIEIRARVDADAPPVMADASAIHQVMMNLGTNAWHAMIDGSGIMQVALDAFDADAEFAARHIDMRPGRYTRLSVGDNGHGMDPTTLKRIFEPFFTTKAPGRGTGLGLATVHGIVMNHDGIIGVRSAPGEGTTFHLYFPALDVDVANLPTEAEDPPRGHGQHVMFVDDEAALAHWGREALERLGYRVTSFTNVLEALDAARQAPMEFALVITDLTMPFMNGFSFAKRLHASHPDLPIILSTGHGADLSEDRIRQYGISGLLLKPSTVFTLASAVHRALTGSVRPA